MLDVKRDYEINEMNEIDEKNRDFVYFVHFVYFVISLHPIIEVVFYILTVGMTRCKQL